MTRMHHLPKRECPVCHEDFWPYRDSQRTCDRKCYVKLPDVRAAVADRAKTQEYKDRKNVARQVAVNPERVEINLRNNLKKYGVTPEWLAAKIEAQGNRCIICGQQPNPEGIKSASRLHVDHDHVTGQNRDLLCCNCNRGIGYLMDDPELLRKAAEYIEMHRAQALADHDHVQAESVALLASVPVEQLDEYGGMPVREQYDTPMSLDELLAD